MLALMPMCATSRCYCVLVVSFRPPQFFRYSLLCAQFLQYARSSSIFMSLFRLDYELHDIPQDEEDNHNLHPLPRQDIWFDSLTDQQCYANTSFTKAQLRRIYDKFGLAAYSRQHQP